MIADEQMTFADLVFGAKHQWQLIDEELIDKLCGIVRVNRNSEDPWPFDDHSTDYYDRSFELYGCRNDLRLDETQRTEAWALGFERCWLNHADGSETYYWKGGGESRKSPGLHAPALNAGTDAPPPPTPKAQP